MCVSCSVLSDFLQPIDCSLSGSSVHGILQARILEWVAIPFFLTQDLPDPGTEPGSPMLQADSLPSELLGKPTLHAAAKSLQLCPTLFNPRDGRPPGSPAPGILQARTLEWVAISFSRA